MWVAVLRTLALCLSIASTFAKAPSNDRARTFYESKFRERAAAAAKYQHPRDLTPRTIDTDSPWYNDRTAPFAVNRTGFPNVTFELPESYSGLLPIDDSSDRELFFWFVPTENEAAKDEIVIWLNGGPGCSSLYGFFKENGPVNWMASQYEPVKNHYAWNNLSNIVWIEQPVGTGYTRGTPNATSQEDAAAQFSGFWKNFVDLFQLQNRKVYLAGESYAGMYVPYFADYMLNQSDTTYFNVSGIMIYDPAIGYISALREAPSLSLVENHRNSFPFNDSFNEFLYNKSSACGFDDFITEGLTYPPKGRISLPKGTFPNGSVTDDCDIWGDVADAAFLLNPCFNVYQVTQLCPIPWDVLGFPYSGFYLPKGYQTPYFNRSDVKALLHVPESSNWTVCADKPVFVAGKDKDEDLSEPSGLNGGPLARVTERINNTVVGHGSLDMIIVLDGVLLTLNNLTWNGAQGFSKTPDEPFYIPYHDAPFLESQAGAGVAGSYGTERGLTFVAIELAGHAVPGFQQAAGYRHLEFLLGRIPSLGDKSPFTTQPDYPQPDAPLGRGTTPVQAVLGGGKI